MSSDYRSKNYVSVVNGGRPSEPVVFGVYTMMSTAILGMGEVLFVMLALLLDVDVAPVMIFFVISLAFILEVIALDQSQ